MTVHNIDLKTFVANGQVECEHKEKLLYVRTQRAIPTQRFDAEHLSINSHIFLPGRFKLPLRIDLTAKIDAPGLYILLGKGHVNFGTLCSDNRRMDDIAAPARKTMSFHNHMDMNEFTDISLIYDFNQMQVLINGEERYYSNKERYMKAKAFSEMNKEGFELKLACDKLVNLCIKSVTITEYGDKTPISRQEGDLPAPIMKNLAIAVGEKPAFEKCISLLPLDIQSEIVKMDEYLKSLKPFKFKRQLEKNGNKITYVAPDYGFSYAIYLSNDIFDHSLQWYLITNGKPETWHRKADLMEETLDRLTQRAPDLAGRMFHSLDDCVGCYRDCLAKTRYKLQDKQKIVCHGKLKFRMDSTGFEDVRTFIEGIKAIV
ncbi:hypothetical protein CLHUN_28640 [Ruminiclostridium hungatei]|uniref:Uncharacterized protein n=1 Tax=Ruminiclostridium hungatei TaxID=48256 RepID=A0A1V4SII6_RUMHU|nr:hypothetical protein [Ruminiclostridium hungatei]OPX43316.1 hypothetical protein CLHUN_28640 [Ruminiclostridium hungatei]